MYHYLPIIYLLWKYDAYSVCYGAYRIYSATNSMVKYLHKPTSPKKSEDWILCDDPEIFVILEDNSD
jgi:hypothetical protein